MPCCTHRACKRDPGHSAACATGRFFAKHHTFEHPELEAPPSPSAESTAAFPLGGHGEEL
jgi:hypothetical protein